MSNSPYLRGALQDQVGEVLGQQHGRDVGRHVFNKLRGHLDIEVVWSIRKAVFVCDTDLHDGVGDGSGKLILSEAK
jgi:hypothetical protein